MGYPIDVKSHSDGNAKAQRMINCEPLQRKHGGRIHHHKEDDGDDDTASHNIHIVVNGKKEPDLGAPPPMSPPPPMGAPPMGPPPGMGGPPPGMGGPPGMGPPPLGAGAGPGPIAMRRGGRAKKDYGGAVADDPAQAEGSGNLPKSGRDGAPDYRKAGGRTRGAPGTTLAESQTDGDKFHPDHGTDTTPARKARGGSTTHKQLDGQPGGGGGGLGRLWKAGIRTKQSG